MNDCMYELQELKARCNRLDALISGPNNEGYKALGIDDQVLLKLQARYMRLYLGVLQERIDRFEEHISSLVA